MKKILLLNGFVFFFSITLFSQSFNQDKIALANFIKRKYISQPWAGVEIFRDYENIYLVSLVKLNPTLYKTDNEMVRVAEVKSRSQANQFLNGSYISSETIIPTTEKVSKKNSSTIQDVSDIIKETSMGFVNSMELISTFISETDSNQKVFIYIKTLDKLKKGRK
jgi:hypothetical protein